MPLRRLCALEVGGLTLALRSDEPQALAELRALWSELPRAERGKADLRYDVLLRPRRRRVVLNGASLFSTPRRDLALAGLELDIYRELTARTPATPLHAGLVSWRGAGVLVAGPSGAGKTSLVRELVGRGARYLSEEHVFLQADGEARGFPRALEGPPAPGWRRDAFGLSHPLQPPLVSCSLDLVVLLGLPRGAAGPQPLTAGVAAARLTEHLLRDARPQDLSALTAAVARASCVSLAHDGVAGAADLVAGLCQRAAA